MIDDILYQIAYTLAFTYVKLLRHTVKVWSFGYDDGLNMRIMVTVKMVDAAENDLTKELFKRVPNVVGVNAHEA